MEQDLGSVFRGLRGEDTSWKPVDRFRKLTPLKSGSQSSAWCEAHPARSPYADCATPPHQYSISRAGRSVSHLKPFFRNPLQWRPALPPRRSSDGPGTELGTAADRNTPERRTLNRSRVVAPFLDHDAFPSVSPPIGSSSQPVVAATRMHGTPGSRSMPPGGRGWPAFEPTGARARRAASPHVASRIRAFRGPV